MRQAKPTTLLDVFALWRLSEPHPGSTLRKYHDALRRLGRHGLIRIEDVTVERVDELQRELLSLEYTPVYVRGEFSALRAMLGYSVPRGWFPKEKLDLIRGLTMPGDGPKSRRRARHLARHEVELLATTAAKVLPRVELPIRVASLSGLRISELARLRAEDVRERLIHVVAVPELEEQGACKTGERTVPVCQELADIFDERLPRSGYLFVAPSAAKCWANRKRDFISAFSLRRELKVVRQAAGLPEDVTFGVLRHTRASWWLQAGCSIYKVADWMGHATETCEVYYGALLDKYDPDCELMPELEGVNPWRTS